MTLFSVFKAAPQDPIFGLNAILKADQRSHKIDLLIGYYKNEDNITPIFDAVKEAEKIVLGKQKDLNYLPIDGLKSYTDHLSDLIFTNEYKEHVYAAQTVGGTSALHHLGKILSYNGKMTIAIPDPTWANHNQIFEYLGFNVISYPYYDIKTQKILKNAFFSFLKSVAQGTAVLLHASCHNPSGADFSNEDWHEIAKICKERKLFPFFDCAYQGLGQGLEEDIQSVRIFANYLDEFFLAYSCSKNFGMYGERTGSLFFYSKHKESRVILESLFKQSMRATYSNPPRQGALIVNEILTTESLKKNWMDELNSYKDRIHLYRKKYMHALESSLSKDFSYVEKGNGLFVFTGLSAEEVINLRDNEAIYLTSDGRLNLTGLNEKNFDRVITALSKYL